jgi:DNA-binding NarL/FixJ family response regulator
MKKKSTEDHIIDALASLTQAQTQIKNDVNRHEKVLAVQSLQIDNLERQVMGLRNAAIAAELKLGKPNKDVAAKYGLSPGRVSQIKSIQ